MKTIKIFLNEDGTVNNFVQDIRINQYSFQDTLLNIYVPYSIVDLNMTSDDVNVIYGTNIQMGMIYTRQNGTEQMGVGYLFTFVKDNVVLNNKRYVLFERTMPKEFTLYSGNQTYAINVVNTKTEITLDDNNEEVSTTSITSIITSARYTLYITPSANFSEDTSETTDLENVIAQVNALLSQIVLKQDKTDSNINVYTTKLHDTTTQIVVNALNSLNTRESASENNLDTLNSDMSQAQQDIINLQNTLIVGYRYLGQITSASDPSDAALTSWATSQGYTLQNGDEIIWVKTVSQGTDIIYVCKYVQTWNWYAVPSVEPASYLTLGLVKGTTSGMIPPSETAPMLVQIANGEILYIYIKKNDGTYSLLHQMLNNHDLTLEQILDGTLSIDKATYALYDESERNNVNKKTINEKFTTPAQVQNQIMDYALPKMFNDLYYFDFDNDTLETSASDLPVSTSYAELDVSTIGTKQVFENTLTFTDKFTLSNKNSFDISLKYDNAGLYGESVDLTLNIYINDDVSPVVSQTKSIVLDASGVLEFRDNLTSIVDEIEIDPNDYIRVELTALVSTAQNVNTIKFYSYQNVVSTFNLNISLAGLIVSEAKKGEYYHFTKTATYNAIDLEVDIDINDTEIPFENLLNGNFLADFDITLNSTFEFAASTLFFPLKVKYTNNFLGTTTTIDMTTRYGEYFIYYRPVYTLEKITDNGVTTYVYHFKFIARYGNNADNTFYVDYPNSTIIKVTQQELTDDEGMGFHYIIGKKIPYIIVDETNNVDASNKLINGYELNDYMVKGYDNDTNQTTIDINAQRVDVKTLQVEDGFIRSAGNISRWEQTYYYNGLPLYHYAEILNKTSYDDITQTFKAQTKIMVYDEALQATGIIIENSNGYDEGAVSDIIVKADDLSFKKSLIYDVFYKDTPEYNFLNDEYLKQENLFNFSTIRSGGYYYYETGAWTNSATYMASDYISVKPNTTYSGNILGHICYYDSSKTYISGIIMNTNGNITTPSNAYYLRYSPNTTSDVVMLNEGSHPYPYQPYNGPIVHKKDIEPVLLWENSSPDTSFAAQDVVLKDSSNFKYLVIEMKMTISSNHCGEFLKIRNSVGKYAFTTFADDGVGAMNIASRSLYIQSTTSIHFYNGILNNTANGDVGIPVAIYGTNFL